MGNVHIETITAFEEARQRALSGINLAWSAALAAFEIAEEGRDRYRMQEAAQVLDALEVVKTEFDIPQSETSWEEIAGYKIRTLDLVELDEARQDFVVRDDVSGKYLPGRFTHAAAKAEADRHGLATVRRVDEVLKETGRA